VLRDVGSVQGVQLVLAAPLDSGRVLSMVVAPRTQLITDDPFAALLGLDVPSIVEPPYRLQVTADEGPARATTRRWTRRDDDLHGDWDIEAAPGRWHAHVEVELRTLDVLFARGGLLVLLNLSALGLLWVLVAVSDPSQRRWLRSRFWRWRASYRARLTATLFAAFVLPSLVFGFWTLNRLRAEDLTSRALLVRETLRAVRVREPRDLVDEAARLETPLFWYRDGVLQAAAEPLHLALAPLGHLLDPVAADEVVFGREDVATRRVSVGGVPTLVGYRTAGARQVLAAPARRTELTLERQQRDVIALLLVSMAVGALIAWGVSGLAARAFAQPIGALRRAAEEVAGGARDLTSLGTAPPSEFRPVFQRFRQMAVELSDSRQDLARAQRVFAWGEMARQVAHEIKNPLTPIRLGVQHLRRAWADQRPDFPQILDKNVDRILGEIDRLDHIARSFSKFGMRPEDAPPTAPVALDPLVRDVVELERIGEGDVTWSVEADAGSVASARPEELREVLLNVLENARLATARHVVVRTRPVGDRAELQIEDDGDGVSDEHLARVFEPRFSTRTSGSGLGLAISRRLVESWGGTIRLERREPRGTRVTIALVASDAT
jgi:signal transduction histidine kinase